MSLSERARTPFVKPQATKQEIGNLSWAWTKAILTLSPIAHRCFQGDDPALAPNLESNFFPRRLDADHIDEMIFISNGGAVQLEYDIIGPKPGRRRRRFGIDHFHQGALHPVQPELERCR